jgi:hypothetical protein
MSSGRVQVSPQQDPDLILLVSRAEFHALATLPRASEWDLPFVQSECADRFEDAFRQLFGDRLWEECRYKQVHIEVANEIPLDADKDYPIPSGDRLRPFGVPRQTQLIPLLTRDHKVEARIWCRLPPEPIQVTHETQPLDLSAILRPEEALPEPTDATYERRFWYLGTDHFGRWIYVEGR